MGVLHGTHEIHDGQQHKNQCLDKTHQNAQKHDRQRRQIEPGQTEQNGEDHLLSEDIPEEPHTQGHDSREMSDQLYGKHERNQPPYRSQEMLNVLGSVEFDADHMGIDEGAQGQSQGGVEIGRG